ncbi:MAG: FeoB-associated Cys-rich membrane protein [Desulfovibrionaceae bacterium]|nr:FeoB-associated Cys-rich membrane protein [Desulfovibrionaceae bacterium]
MSAMWEKIIVAVVVAAAAFFVARRLWKGASRPDDGCRTCAHRRTCSSLNPDKERPEDRDQDEPRK